MTEIAPTSTPAPALPEDNSVRLMDNLILEDREIHQQTVDQILERDDQRFIAVFIELLRANQIGLVPQSSYQTNVKALESLSGQKFGGDWPAWVTWYGQTDLVPPPGFTSWKGSLLARIDPGFGDFLRDEHPSQIRVEEIAWGGVVVDGIPALDNPRMIPAEAADYLERTAEPLRERKLDVKYVVLPGTAGETITNYAHENGFTLIAIATHGHGGLRRLALGSTADFVLRHSSLPVLMVRAGK